MTASASLLAKLSGPRLSGAVARERLHRRLDALVHHPIVWISAPPGAGKTTLLAQWLESRSLSHQWYRLDREDADPSTFFHFLGLAARHGRLDAAPLPRLAPEYTAHITAFARRWFRSLFATLSGVSVLVIDDIHELASAESVLAVLAEAAGEIPPGLQLMLVSREEPTRPFTRLLANNLMGWIGADEFRMTAEESAALVRERLPGDVTRAERIHTLSAGWAAGLVLIAERMRRGLGGDPADPASSLEDVFDYFAAEMLARTTPDNTRILLTLSHFPSIDGETATLATGTPQAVVLLDYLARHHFFVERRAIDGGRENLYQFHPLFHAFLQRAEAAEGDPHQRNGRRANAARLLESRGEPALAADLYLDAEAWADARRVIGASLSGLLREGRHRRVLDWLARFPDTAFATDPWLFHWQGAATGFADPAEARRLYALAANRAGAVGDRWCRLLSTTAILESVFVEFTNFQDLDPWVDVVEAQIAEGVPFPDADSELRVCTALCAALSHRHGAPPSLRHWIDRTLGLLDRAKDPELRAMAGTYLLRCAAFLGDELLMDDVLPRMEAIVDDDAVAPHVRGLGAMFMAWAHVATLNDEGVSCNVERLSALANAYALPQLRRFAAIGGWWGDMMRLHVDAVAAWTDRMAQTMDHARRYDVASFNCMRSWLALTRGDSDVGLTMARRAARDYEDLGGAWHRLLGRGMLVWALVDNGRTEEAETAIVEADALAARFGLSAYRTYACQGRAMLALLRGDDAALLRHLEALFAASASHGTGLPTRFFATWMPRLCAEALKADIRTDHVRALIRRHGWQCEGDGSDRWPWPIRVHALGRFVVQIDDQPLTFGAKVPRKTLALLKAVVALGGASVPEYRITDALWPDDEADAARAALSVTVHRLRKLLGHPDAILVEDGAVKVNPRVCWVDTGVFERAADAAADLPTDPAELLSVESALGLYRGVLLPADAEEPWSAATRERLRAKYVRSVVRLGRHYEALGLRERAIELYLRSLDADEMAEPFYQGLMRCHAALGQDAEALAVYHRLSRTFAVTAGLKPSPVTEALRAQLSGMTIPAR